MHLKGWKRYAFDVLGPNGALVSKNRAKMAKIGFTHMAIFWKNISFDLLQNGPKYTSRTNLHFDIDLGEEVHQKNFTTNKLDPFGPPLGTQKAPGWANKTYYYVLYM